MLRPQAEHTGHLRNAEGEPRQVQELAADTKGILIGGKGGDDHRHTSQSGLPAICLERVRQYPASWTLLQELSSSSTPPTLADPHSRRPAGRRPRRCETTYPGAPAYPSFPKQHPLDARFVGGRYRSVDASAFFVCV